MIQRRNPETVSVTREGIHLPDLGIKPEPWMEGAVCAQTDPEIFFPEKGNKGGVSREAQRLCATCDVSVECLDYALRFERDDEGTATSYVRVGIYGGLTPMERRDLEKRRAS